MLVVTGCAGLPRHVHKTPSTSLNDPTQTMLGKIAVHDTADPEVIVVEYHLAGTMTASGERRSSPLIAVIRAIGDRITHWREYQDTHAIAQAMTGS